MAGERFLTRLADASIAAILVEGAKPIGTWLIPWTLSAVAFGVGVFQQPLVYVIAAASLTFAAVTTALLRYDKWRFLRSPRDKVIFVQVGLYIDYVYDRPTGEITGIQKMQIGRFLKIVQYFLFGV